MNKRVFTVGSLIPGKMVPIQQSPIIKEEASPEKMAPLHQSAAARVSPISEKIIILQDNNKFELLPVKGKLLDAALNQGKAIRYHCRKGTCGQCKVKIVQGSQGLSTPNEQEHNKLKRELANGYRLACQANIL